MRHATPAHQYLRDAQVASAQRQNTRPEGDLNAYDFGYHVGRIIGVWDGQMARIVGIHGIAQQVRGPEVLRAAWLPALRDGMVLSGAELLDADDLEIAFYGDLFRARGGKAFGSPPYVATDVEEGFERELLEAWWAQAASGDDDIVFGPDTATKLRTSKTVQRALNVLSQSRFFAGLSERLIIGFIKQVHAYLNDDSVRAEIQERVARKVTTDTAVLVGHSLGTVVAYEAACAHPDWDLVLVTLGSPLGIRNLVFDRLRPPPEGDRGQFPVGAAAWTNIVDTGDVVALAKRLAPLFGERVEDLLVNNGSKAHDISPYLTAPQTGHAIAEGLARRAG
jgi:pimeloyl-ACP methyl ester carboxylesterase